MKTPASMHKASNALLMMGPSSDEVVTDKYHLLWSPNFWKKMIVGAVFWFFIQFFSKKIFHFDELPFFHVTFCHGETSSLSTKYEFQRMISTAVVLPLLSSSCCAIQLIINAISGWGCAGFNKYLGTSSAFHFPTQADCFVSNLAGKYFFAMS